MRIKKSIIHRHYPIRTDCEREEDSTQDTCKMEANS